MIDFLNVGLIQTTLDCSIAWKERQPSLEMNEYEAKRIWSEVRNGFTNFNSLSPENKPKIILLPEFSLPFHYENELVNLAKSVGAVVIAGKDFITSEHFGDSNKYVENKAIVIVPQNWPEDNPSFSASKFYFGKSFFSNLELKYFKPNFEPKSSLEMYILNAGEYGNIGVAICADFFDIERFVIYKGRIHHLFVIAYNRDVNSFYFLAEAISRLVFCNVIICNTGYYGGSVAFSPYSEPHERYIYKHEGRKLFTSQVVSLPVESLNKSQKKEEFKIFKSAPPQYTQKTLFPSIYNDRTVIEKNLNPPAGAGL